MRGNPAFFAGFPSEVGKSAFGLFHLAAFPQPVAPSFFPLLFIIVIFLHRPPSGHFLCYLNLSIGHFMYQRHGRGSGFDPGAQLAIALPPRVIRAGSGRLCFLGLGLSGCYRMSWNWAWNLLPTHRPIAIANL
jgi:hypothetical protein